MWPFTDERIVTPPRSNVELRLARPRLRNWSAIPCRLIRCLCTYIVSLMVGGESAVFTYYFWRPLWFLLICQGFYIHSSKYAIYFRALYWILREDFVGRIKRWDNIASSSHDSQADYERIWSTYLFKKSAHRINTQPPRNKDSHCYGSSRHSRTVKVLSCVETFTSQNLQFFPSIQK